MKIKKIYMMLPLAMAALFTTSCMDKDWETPSFSETIPYGNNNLQATNVITIAQLKTMYPDYAANYTCTLMDSVAQLKVYVTGNDVSGNLYNAVAVQDENGDALIISVGENGMYGYLPVGQEILIETKGLYIGGYGSQPQIGQPYTNSSGNTYVSRMSSSLWQKNFRILPTKHEVNIPSYTTDEFKKLDIASECGKLMTIKGVSIKGADGKKTWANTEDAGSQTSVTLYFNELSQSYQVYNSTYCKFALDTIPEGKMDLTGIWKRYNNYWELIMRDLNDVKVSE